MLNSAHKGQSYDITETINTGLFHLSGTVTSAPATRHEVVIVAIDNCSYDQSLIPEWFNQNYAKVHEFFATATFDNFNYAVDWLTKDTTHAFIMPNPNIPKFDGSCEHVHSLANIRGVLADVDNIYDFNDYDYDNDGTVSVHFTSININVGTTHNGGITGVTCFTYISKDISRSKGTPIIIHVDRQTRGYDSRSYFGVFFHESGHSFFSFPDMDHSGVTDFNHYGIGGFDIMCSGGFQGVPSAYNPWFRDARGWFTPTPITSNGPPLIFQDFQTSGQCYIYTPSPLPSSSIPDEKFYISYHFPTNYFYSTWPYKNPLLGGVLIWHVKKRNTDLNLYNSYSDYRTRDITIKDANGKYIWQEYPDRVTNTGAENALTGRDLLGIRKIGPSGVEIQGPYYNIDKGNSSTFYTPGDGKDFTFYSNPNSNWYVNSGSENYAQSIVSGFSMKNLRSENGTIKADFSIDDYTIQKNTTFATGKWYFNNSITVAAGVTLNIQPGTELVFNNNSSLIVNGTLNANGTSSNMVTFDFIAPGTSAANYIRFNPGSGGSISYSKIKDAYIGIYCLGSSPDIFSNTFIGDIYGIYCSEYSSPEILNNTISGAENYGLRCNVYSSPDLDNGYNVITQNNDGINCTNNSSPILGLLGGGYNSIYNNTYSNVRAYYDCNIYAYHNYWGYVKDMSKIIADSASNAYIYSDYEMANDPNAGRSLSKTIFANNNSLQNHSQNNSSGYDNEITNALVLQHEGKYNEAILSYNKILESDIKTSKGSFIISKISECYEKSGRNDFIDYLNKALRPKLSKEDGLSVSALELESHWLTKEGKYDEGIKNLKKIQNDYKDKEEAYKYALFNEGFTYLVYLKDRAKAMETFNYLETKYPEDNIIAESKILLGEKPVKFSEPKQIFDENKTKKSQINKNIPEDYELLGNFPNPFNPSTTISYAIPKQSLVEVKIYNIMGNEVKSFILNSQDAGYHSLVWDGKNMNNEPVSSGTYIYKLRAVSYEDGRVFERSAKMLLVK